MNSFQSSSINSPLAALVQKAGSFFPSKALNMWWHLPGRIFSRAVKVENVPVLGKPEHQTLQTWLTSSNLLTCSDQNIFHILIHLLLGWGEIHVIVNRYNKFTVAQWQVCAYCAELWPYTLNVVVAAAWECSHLLIRTVHLLYPLTGYSLSI